MGCTVATAVPRTEVKKTEDITPVKVETTVASNEGVKFDGRLPLTVRQRFNITKSWKAICRDIAGTGTNMFLRMFETNAEVRRLFKILDGRDVTELRGSGVLENHVRMVMYTLDEAIASLDDVDAVIEMLDSLGRWHMTKGGFMPEIFWCIEEPFLMAVKETLGDRYTANMEHIYSKVINFILETLINGCRNSAIDNGVIDGGATK